LYNNAMGRPRGTGKNTAMVNGRVTAEQMEWLLARSEELGGNLSAAFRQTITDARFLEMARSDWRAFRQEHPDVSIPYNDEGASWVWEFVLGFPASETADLELREQEAEQRAN
jgi:hypothetical protein